MAFEAGVLCKKMSERVMVKGLVREGGCGVFGCWLGCGMGGWLSCFVI